MLLSLTFCVLLNCPTRRQRFPETISGVRREHAFGSGYESTTVTLGIQNVFDEDPSFVAGSGENGYGESLATIKGRFWYLQLKKRF
jgi:outer membrane receptor protein involved in Fe transport